jgi:uncharacterized Zn-finger protein
MNLRQHIATDPVTGRTLACAGTLREVDWSDLPLCCPMPAESLWNAHPHVWLPIHESDRERCPYCSTVYALRPPRLDLPPPRFANARIEARDHEAVIRLRAAAIATQEPQR